MKKLFFVILFYSSTISISQTPIDIIKSADDRKFIRQKKEYVIKVYCENIDTCYNL